ncbi:YvrJ family protein [Alteribacillus bidgolensis]|uniref:YvrJ protein family protein n=1 Tax=Alteribacillus bidgolensis TaxID=930129 RepID=A0A1G8LZG2_9BACI|nr:YvrJ family protein [Alteribacillus bidgolensis]SDI60540.1 YvrJ protein family protein [Alteribacillus bidgolensis]
MMMAFTNATEFVQLLANFGFPVVVTFYLLFRFERKIEQMSFTLQRLHSSFLRPDNRKEDDNG